MDKMNFKEDILSLSKEELAQRIQALSPVHLCGNGCGNKATKQCSACKSIYYDTIECQR